VYAHANSEGIRRLQVCQNRAIRCIDNIKKFERITPHYRKWQIHKIRERYELHVLHTTHRCLYGFAPTYLSSLFILRSEVVTDRSSRAHALALQAPSVGRDIPEKSFSVLAHNLW
jgi:hypothetical protein